MGAYPVYGFFNEAAWLASQQKRLEADRVQVQSQSTAYAAAVSYQELADHQIALYEAQERGIHPDDLERIWDAIVSVSRGS